MIRNGVGYIPRHFGARTWREGACGGTRMRIASAPMKWDGWMYRVAMPVRVIAVAAISAAGVFAVAGAALAQSPSPSPASTTVPGNPTGTATGTASATATELATPIPNVPTPPPGPIQPTDRLIFALDMGGANEIPPVTATAIGSFGATLTGSMLCYTFGAEGSGLTMAHIYHGAAGTNGDPVVQLFMNLEGVPNILTSGCISAVNIGGSLAGDWAGFMRALDSGGLYVSVRSLAHPDGETRGQLFHSSGQVAPTSTPATAATPGAPGAPNLGSGRADANGASNDWLMTGEILLVWAVATLGGWAALRRRVAR